jgi:hypothetical protein
MRSLRERRQIDPYASRGIFRPDRGSLSPAIHLLPLRPLKRHGAEPEAAVSRRQFVHPRPVQMALAGSAKC